MSRGGGGGGGGTPVGPVSPNDFWQQVQPFLQNYLQSHGFAGSNGQPQSPAPVTPDATTARIGQQLNHAGLGSIMNVPPPRVPTPVPSLTGGLPAGVGNTPQGPGGPTMIPGVWGY